MHRITSAHFSSESIVVTDTSTGRSKSLCAPDDYSIKNKQKYFKEFQSLTMIT
jgi:hypothetical protein